LLKTGLLIILLLVLLKSLGIDVIGMILEWIKAYLINLARKSLPEVLLEFLL